MYSGQKKKVNGPESAKYFFPIEKGKFLCTVVLDTGYLWLSIKVLEYCVLNPHNQG